MDENTTIAHYTILRPLGKGGMGEVYLAEDTKLDRQVAIKVLPDTVRSDPERLARFRREAKAAASLNHPNIATIHSIEEADDVLFIVMEYVEGETLSERVPADGMDLDTFFSTFIPLSDALAHAHQQGRVHRDLKPGNIMVAKDGTPKVLDFGLARIMPVIEEPEEEANQLGSQDETRTLNANELNKPVKPPTDPSAMSPGPKLMGTPQYMSPEQAESEPLDHRTDIFSFGVVMYEALTGRKAFEGSSRTSLLASILKVDPEPAPTIKPVTPYLLWQAIDSCLRKERTARTQTAYELYNDLKSVQKDVDAGTVLVDASTIPEPQVLDVAPVEPERIPFWRRSVMTAVATIILVAITALVTWFTAVLLLTPADSPVRKFSIPWPESPPGSDPVISPDGSMIVYPQDGRLWIRDLNKLESRPITDSEQAWQSLWSPQSDFIIYSSLKDGAWTLSKVSAQGGPSTILCPLSGPAESTWGPDGTIVVGLGTEGLHTVSAKGGELQVLTLSDTSSGEIALYGPELLPDGNTLLIDVSYTDGEEGLLLLSEDTRIPIHRERGTIAYPAYSPTGHILFQRDWPVSEGIWALPFDVSTMTVTGDPFPVASGGSAPSLSEDGTLVYRSGSGVGAMRQLVWVDRTGTVQDTIGQPQDEITSPALSPDGRFVAVWGTDEDETDIWLHDVTRGTKTPLSYDIPNTWRPSWSPDGDRIVFQSRDPAQNFKSDLYMQTTDGRSPPEPLVKTDADEYGPHWSPDGKTILYTVTKPDGDRDLWMLSLSDPKTPQPFLSTPFDERNPFFSPDGRYVAYQSNKSGRAEIYVTRFPDAEGEWMVSVDGGVSAQWLGGEIFYVDLETNTLMVAQARTYPAFHAELPRTVFSGESINAALATPGTFNYTVSSDGQRFVVVQQADAGETPKLTVVQNWSAEFKERE